MYRILFFLLFAQIYAIVPCWSQKKTPRITSPNIPDDWQIEDSPKFILAKLPPKSHQIGATKRSTDIACNTSTFYLRISAPAGQTIELGDLETLPGGDYILVGTMHSANTKKGLVVRINNMGVIVQQKLMTLNNENLSIDNAKVRSDGKIVISGRIENENNTIFIATLENDFSLAWAKTTRMPDLPQKICTDVFDESKISMAVRCAENLVFAVWNENGDVLWQKQLTPDGLNELAGFTRMNWTDLALVYNCNRNNKRVTEIVQVDQVDGHTVASALKGNILDENRVIAVGSFNVRQHIISISNRFGPGFSLERDISFSATQSETNHIYTTVNNVDFSVSGAMDNAGDIFGITYGTNGKLTLLRHVAYNNNTPPTFVKEFDIPPGASLKALTRSFDEGILCGINTTNFNEIVLIKTDSIGTLPGCSSEELNVVTKTLLIPNTVTNINNSPITLNATESEATDHSVSLNTHFNCQQNFCPVVQDIDTCLSTYFKTFRSNSYSDIFGYYCLMRNNRHFISTARYDRVIGELNTLTNGLKLFDETGKFIKGINVFFNGTSQVGWMKQMDDRSVMLVQSSSDNNIPTSTFILMSDNLDIIWQRSFKGIAFSDSHDSGTDIHKDDEGNYYVVATVPRFWTAKSKVNICKLGSSGELIWNKSYTVDNGWLGSNAITSSASSLFIISAGSQEGSVSMKIDKNNGTLLNIYNFRSTYTGSTYQRHAKLENNQISYVGGVTDDDLFMVMTFDTTGRPMKMRYIPNSSPPRGVVIKNGFIYATYLYYNGTSISEVVLKIDSNLKIQFFKEYVDGNNRTPKALQLSPEDNIYVAGNVFSGPEAYPYLVKYNAAGERGTCAALSMAPPMQELDPQVNSIGYAQESTSIENHSAIIDIVPDFNGQTVAAVLCKSIPQCLSLELSGPDTVCLLNKGYKYFLRKSPGCTIQPQWLIDTSFSQIENLTDTTAFIRFKQSGTTNITVNLNGGCTTLQNRIATTIQRSANELNLGTDKSICTGDSIILHAGSGYSNYSWQDGSADSLYTVKNPGLYFVKTTNACLEQSVDSIFITQALTPLLNLGYDTSLCKGSILHLNAPVEFMQYYWSDAQNTPTTTNGRDFLINSSQFIGVKAITKEGCAVDDSVFVDTKEARPVFLGNDTSFCAGVSLTLSAGENYIAYLWNNGHSSSFTTIQEAGIYWVNVTDTNHCEARDTLNITQVFPAPKPNLGADFELCIGTEKQLDAGNYTTYEWINGSQDRYYSPEETGSYWVKVTDDHGCTGTDTVILKSIIPRPSNFLNAIDSICQYEEVQIYSSSLFESYSWSTGSNQPVLTISEPGQYSLTVKDNKGCIGSDTVSVLSKNCMSGLFIPNAFTPNGDQINDVFRARAFGKILSFRLEIYDRFGQLIFSTTNPQEGWDGLVNGLPGPIGVFAWQCFCHLQGSEPIYKKGTVTLLR